MRFMEVVPQGLMLCDDLIYFSRVAGAARAIGAMVRMVKSVTELLATIRQDNPGGIIVDLENPGLDLRWLLQELRTSCPKMPCVVAYGSHVHADTLRAARKAGCDRVMPRSQFVVDLENDLAEWLGVKKKSQENPDNQ
jgi:CheY-like chemotaxis protein